MKLKSFGCSFIFGTDLGDEQAIPNRPIIASQLTWPALLAQHLHSPYECFARPGSGNLQIAEQILNQACLDHSDTCFVIGWTWIDRFDYWSDQMDWPNNRWQTLVPCQENSVSQVYFKELHAEYSDKLKNLMHIKLVINTLKQKQIPFLMTYMDDLLFDRRWNTGPAVEDLQDHVIKHMTTFENLNFLDWSRKKGFKESATWHPQGQAHESAFELIKSRDLPFIKPAHNQTFFNF